MKTKIKQLRSSMSVNIIGSIVLLLVVFGLVVSTLSYMSFTDSFKEEYAVSTYHMADTASTLVNGDRLDEYLAGEEMEEYQLSKQYLDSFCSRMNVSLIYVIKVDTSDYGRFVSIFNPVNNAVDDSEYVEWELGYKRDTTNEEYRQKYRAMYEQTAPYETVYRIKTTDGQHPHITTMVPVKDSAGETAAILCVQRPVREFNAARMPYLKSIVASTIILAVISSLVAYIFIRRQVVDPVRRVSEEAVRFARENTKGRDLGTVSRFAEFQGLADSIVKMESDMGNYIESLTAVTAEKERIGAELVLAERIQRNSIPGEFPAFPDRTDFDIYASMDPAREVGGDFYNFFLIDDDHLAVAIGDVSGKGVPASLFMMVTNILISDRTKMGGRPGDILTFINTNLCAHNRADMFVSVWLGILELSTGRLVAANAGHEYPILKRAGEGFALYKDKHCFVIGGMEDVSFCEYELALEPGDRLFLYTDGVPEASAEEGSMFGMDRLISALNDAPDASPREIISNVSRAVDGFVKDAEQFDDLTMLCLEYRGQKKE